MSTSYFVTPYDPELNRESTTKVGVVSDMNLNIDDFINQLSSKWDSIKIYREDNMINWVIEQGIDAGFEGLVHDDRQTVSFNFVNDFILWYRKYIPLTQPLFLFDSSSFSRLQLTNETTMQDIQAFFKQSP